MNQGFSRRWRLALLPGIALILTGSSRAAETIPAKPTRYFNDYALTVKPETAERLNSELENLEKESSNQVLAVIYPTMQSDGDVADYCLRTFRSWQVGQKDKNNGAVLFVFLQSHKMWIQTGRGLEGALPDATCKDITADVIGPRFKANDYDGGLTAGVEAIIAATKGEYKGTGTTDYQREHANDGGKAAGGLSIGTLFFLIVVFLIIRSFFGRRGGGGTMLGGGGPPIFFPGGFGGGFGGGGGGFGGDGSSGGDGGGFSSGGGDTGGGGAGSDW